MGNPHGKKSRRVHGRTVGQDSALALVDASVEVSRMGDALCGAIEEEIAGPVAERFEEVRSNAGEIAKALHSSLDLTAVIADVFTLASEAADEMVIQHLGAGEKPQFYRDDADAVARDFAHNAVEAAVLVAIQKVEEIFLGLAASRAANAATAHLAGTTMRHGVGLKENLQAAAEFAAVLADSYQEAEQEQH